MLSVREGKKIRNQGGWSFPPSETLRTYPQARPRPYHAELGLQLNLQVLDRAAQLRDLRPAALQGFGVGGHLAVQLLRLEGRMGPWGLRKLAEVRQRAGATPEP